MLLDFFPLPLLCCALCAVSFTLSFFFFKFFFFRVIINFVIFFSFFYSQIRFHVHAIVHCCYSFFFLSFFLFLLFIFDVVVVIAISFLKVLTEFIDKSLSWSKGNNDDYEQSRTKYNEFKISDCFSIEVPEKKNNYVYYWYSFIIREYFVYSNP